MRAPPEFLKFAACFHQDVFDLEATDEAVIDSALGGLSSREQESLRDFLRSIIASDAKDDELAELWNVTQSDFLMPSSGGARKFYHVIVDRIVH